MTSCGLPADVVITRPLRRWPRLRGPGLDLTGLSVLRIATAAWLLLDLLQRAAGIGLLQSDGGAFSRATLIAESGAHGGANVGEWSLHLITGSIELQGVLLAIAALAHVTLLVGWRTRASAVISAIFLVSLAHRTPLAALPLDPLLAALAWWCAVLPCGARLSLDAARRGPGGPPARLSGWLSWLFAVTMVMLTVGLARISPLLAVWPLIMVALPCIPHTWWQRIPAAWKRPAVTIWIDGECGICTRAGRLLTQIHGGDLTLRLIQEDPQVHALSDAHTSWVVDAGGQRLLGWAGVRAMCWRSPWLWPLALPLPWLGEEIYATIATNRHRPWWGWMGPIPAEEPLRPLMQWAIAVLVFVCLSWEPAMRASGVLVTAAPGLGLLTAPAIFTNGTRGDLRTGGKALIIEPAAALPDEYRAFSSPRTRAHLSRLSSHPLAARAYLDHLTRLAAQRSSAVQQAELRAWSNGPDGWRSTMIATPPWP